MIARLDNLQHFSFQDTNPPSNELVLATETYNDGDQKRLIQSPEHAQEPPKGMPNVWIYNGEAYDLSDCIN